MYNIDLSFIKNSELNSYISDLEIQYNNEFKDKIIEDLNKIQLNKCNCDECCNLDLSSQTPLDERNIVEAISKGIIGKHFCTFISNDTVFQKNDIILVEIPEGTEVAIVTETNPVAKFKRQKFGLCGDVLPKIIRKLNEDDLKKYETNIQSAKTAKNFFLDAIKTHNLEMKLVDVHYQFDRKKLYFYYTADGRIDFRQLVKELANEFRTRIELRQIGVRDEAKLIGGVGSCGREYCCTSFISSFKKITTQVAHDQNLTSFLAKHSGPCGKLKCCLSFEAEQ